MTELTMIATAPPAFAQGINNPFFDSWSKLAKLYKDAMGADAEQLLISSARIIHEHTMRALVEASKPCAEALVKNAAAVQQQSLVRMADTNQKAMEMMGRAFIDVWMVGLKPASPRQTPP